MSIFALFACLLVCVAEKRLCVEGHIGGRGKSGYVYNPARELFGSARHVHLLSRGIEVGI